MPGAKEFALRRCFSAEARKSSPCKPKMGEKRCFQARWASFFAEMPVEGPCWANFFAPVGAPARCAVLEAPSTPEVVAVLHYTKPSYSVSPACRTPCSAIPPAAQCRIRFCVRTGFALCVDGCAHLVAALQECHRFAGVFAAYPASFVPPDTRRNPGPRRVDHLHHHTPITLSDHPTTRAANQLVTRLNIAHQSL